MRAARNGNVIKNSPTGFPLFYDKRKPRVVTSDPWAFLTHLAVTRLQKSKEDAAKAYLEQGREFFEAAQNPRYYSRPLLYYYALLNVVKAAILIRKVDLPAAAKHGISDPRANSKKRLRFEGQQVHIKGRAKDHSEIFPEFLEILGYRGKLPRNFNVLNLLSFIPNIHRTYVTVENCQPIFLPVKQFQLRHENSEIWVRVRLNRADKDVADLLPRLKKRRHFQRVLEPVKADDECKNSEHWFETKATVPARKNGFDKGINTLAKEIRTLGISPILTAQGFRFYLTDSAENAFVPYLAAAFAGIFYLGSITRYKPDVFDKIISGRHSWVVEEFLTTQPTQFLYSISSELAGVDVVRPYAALV